MNRPTSNSNRIVFHGSKVLLPDLDELIEASIVVDTDKGTILSVTEGPLNGIDDNIEVIDAGDDIILPGLVDTHVHLNEPGRTDWEGFWTGTRAALSGGVTTVVDMPLNSIPPTTTVENLAIKRDAAQGQCWTDVGFWGGVIPSNENQLVPLVEAGVRGFKCFMIESGVEEFPCVTEQDLHKSMLALKDQSSTVLAFHAELDTPEGPLPDVSSRDQTHYSTFLNSRPQHLEVNAISLITELQTRFPSLRCHIVHLSAASALPIIREAKAAGAKLTVETCFHYLCLSSDEIPDGKPEFKCCPPIRDNTNRELLWEALKDGTIDSVVSDHSPCVADLKKLDEGDLMSAWGGISTLGLGLSLLWTESQKNQKGVGLSQIIKWTSTATAKHAGLDGTKGAIRVGADADIMFWDPEAEFQVTRESLQFKNKLSPYQGFTLKGQAQRVYLRGRLVYSKGQGFDGFSPLGKLL